jgi:hypothetical protein
LTSCRPRVASGDARPRRNLRLDDRLIEARLSSNERQQPR